MERYRNSGGNSGIEVYEIGEDYVAVRFNGNSRVYSYSYSGGAGEHHVENMKELAINGSGLNSYIMRHVRNLYDK